MSRLHILTASVALAAIVGAAILFGFFGGQLSFNRPGAPQIARTDAPQAAAPDQQAAAATPSAPRSPSGDDKPAALVESLAAALAPAARSPAQQTDSGPAFDVVRVSPEGDAVIAGRAAPGAIVELMRDGKPLDRAVADKSGNFVMTPSQLPEGNYGLKLRSALAGGKEEMSKETVTVAVAPNRQQPPVVTRRPPEPSVVVAKPAPPKPAPAAAAAAAVVAATTTASTVTVARIEAGPGGKLSVEGRGRPGATIRLYLNDSYLAASTAGPDGSLKFAVDGGVRPGDYRIRLEEVDAAGVAKARAESPFTVTRTMVAAGPVATPPEAPAAAPPPAAAVVARAPTPDVATRSASQDAAARQPALDAAARQPPPVAPARPTSSDTDKPRLAAAPEAQARAPAAQETSPSVVVVPAIRTTVVSRGDSLWRISEETYGSGIRYPVIYHANQQHIRNPNLIYPGQIFVLPQHADAGEKKR
jgi:nucleoid-associated protein YgaU